MKPGYFFGVALAAGADRERNWSADLFNWLNRNPSVENRDVLALDAA